MNGVQYITEKKKHSGNENPVILWSKVYFKSIIK